MRRDQRKRLWKIGFYRLGGDTKDTIARCLQQLLALIIAFLLRCVNRAIHFHDEMMPRRVEIDDEWANDDLPPERYATQSPITQCIPKHRSRRCRVRSEFPRPFNQRPCHVLISDSLPSPSRSGHGLFGVAAAIERGRG